MPSHIAVQALAKAPPIGTRSVEPLNFLPSEKEKRLATSVSGPPIVSAARCVMNKRWSMSQEPITDAYGFAEFANVNFSSSRASAGR